jgi:hypothetical protein
MKSSKLIIAVLVLQGLILLGQWTGGHDYLTTARGQVPDPANRQLQMIDELKSTNQKLDKIISVLEGGTVQVKVQKTDEAKGGPAK